jgi:putative peptide maturation dehydrogenase
MYVRRCTLLFVELDHEPRVDFLGLLSGGDGLACASRWRAHVAHSPVPVTVTLAQLAVLQQVSADVPCALSTLGEIHGEAVIAEMLSVGLLLGDGEQHVEMRARDERVRGLGWWPPALLAQQAGSWQGIDVHARSEAGLMPTYAQMVELHGQPPHHEHRRVPQSPPLPLALPSEHDFDRLLAQRATCRNFDADAVLGAADLAAMLYRVWGAVGTMELAPGAIAMKKSSPAGGGLHAVEAYLLVQRAEGLAPGLYHYLPLQHALEPLQVMEADAAAALAHRFVAGQDWFENVPVMVIMTARFDRLFWKYRQHGKAWRVLHLDAGHLSQTMYLSAAELGLGAFVTAAINDREIEPALGLVPLQEGAIAIVGFGARAATRSMVELDQLTPSPAGQRRAAVT